MATDGAFFEKNVHKFVALNPCAVINPVTQSVEETVVLDEITGKEVINPLTDEP